MPYIVRERRAQIDSLEDSPQNAGELNYALTMTVLEYLGTDYNYQRINDIVGALESCKAEFQRRIVAPYEDTKIIANGDVF